MVGYKILMFVIMGIVLISFSSAALQVLELQDANTENLEDLSHDQNGAQVVMEVEDRGKSNSSVKFDITSLSASKITSAWLDIFNIGSGGSPTFDVDIYNTSDQAWTEAGSVPTPDSLITTFTVAESVHTHVDITSLIEGYYNSSQENATLIFVADVGGSSSDYWWFSTKEEGTASRRPYINITYYPPDSVAPNMTIVSPEVKYYSQDTVLFNITSEDAITFVDTCSYSLDAGVTRIIMTNISNEYTATNSTMTQGSHTVNYYCNDTINNLNDSESISFDVEWGGSLFTNFRINENTGTITHDVSGQSNNGTLDGATWTSDNINLTLVANTDYNLTGSLFTILTSNFAWRNLQLEYSTYAEVIESIREVPSAFFSIPTMITIMILIIVIIFIITSLVKFNKERA